jgi:hypothetical protein
MSKTVPIPGARHDSAHLIVQEVDPGAVATSTIEVFVSIAVEASVIPPCRAQLHIPHTGFIIAGQQTSIPGQVSWVLRLKKDKARKYGL